MLAGVGLAWHGRVAGARWQAALDEVRAVEARLVASVDERPALWGETTDERAQPHYDRALAAVASWDADEVGSARRAEDAEARGRRAALVAAGAEALEALHRGAHAGDATRSVDWSQAPELPIRKLMRVRFLTNLSEMQAAILLEEGRDLAAVGVLLDAMQFAGDLTQGPLLFEEMIGLALLSPAILTQGVADGALLELSDDAARRLAAGLSALDRRLGWRVQSLEGELVFAARCWEAVLRGEGVLAWKGLVHARDQGHAADHVVALRDVCASLDRAFAAGPQELFEELDRVAQRVEARDELPLHAFDSAQRSRFYSVGRLRLLAYALGGADAPRDPWTRACLRTEAAEGGTRLRLEHAAFRDLELLVAR